MTLYVENGEIAFLTRQILDLIILSGIHCTIEFSSLDETCVGKKSYHTRLEPFLEHFELESLILWWKKE